MRERAEASLILALGTFGVLGGSAAAFSEASQPVPAPETAQVETLPQTTASDWFEGMRPYCNPVEVATRLDWNPAPETQEGTKYEAACYALAGRMDEARASLLALPGEERWRGAGIVFNVAHPAADAGDELATGPIMELVVEFWPNHYQALYHAGAAAYQRGETDRARAYLERFMEEYANEDGWRANAREMLGALG